jgi:hypothetical protein
VEVASWVDSGGVRRVIEVGPHGIGGEKRCSISPDLEAVREGTRNINAEHPACLSGLRVLMVLCCFAGVAIFGTTTLQAAPNTWVVTPSPNSSNPNNGLGEVSCASSTSCMAVGEDSYSETEPASELIEAWNGTTWTIVPSPNPGVDRDLTAVSCSSPTSCVAVGYYFAGGGSLTLVESWNGVAWTVAPSPSPGDPQSSPISSELNGVSCTSSTNCVAVGYIWGNLFTTETLIESWNGRTWSVNPSPNSGAASNALNGVSCVSTDDCVAVGYIGDPSASHQTLIESWNGSSWMVIPSPSPGSAVLGTVSCTGANYCVAVGNLQVGINFVPLIESWNGSSWTVTPNPSQDSGLLEGVSCAGRGNCVAVGSSPYDVGVASETLVESLNGSNWVVTPSPNPGAQGNGLGGVSCASSLACVAVGGQTSGTTTQTLAEIGTTSSVPQPCSYFGPGANLQGCNLTDADLAGDNLTGANLVNADLTGANLSGATLTDANLTDANLDGATLTGVISGRVIGSPSALPPGWSFVAGYLLNGTAPPTGADLAGADFSGENLTGLDLSGVNLTGANLFNADLTGANLSGAKLTGASITDANLSGANLSAVISGGLIGSPSALPPGWSVVGGFLEE